jgi:tRNA1(Val) A37 N6-methylase TrmN6
MLTSHDITQDYILGGRVSIRQPSTGYRVAIDPIFLASSINAVKGETILDVGAGVGSASLCLSLRIPGLKITGLEVQKSMVRLASENIAINNMRNSIEMLNGNLIAPPPRLAAGTFSHVMVNPPYLEETASKINYVNENKKISHLETVSFDMWARFCMLMVRPNGTITFIHSADKLDNILSIFLGKVGDISVYPLWPGNDDPAKRVIVRVRKNSQAPMKLLQGMKLHDSTGKYSRDAEHILRDGCGLDW